MPLDKKQLIYLGLVLLVVAITATAYFIMRKPKQQPCPTCPKQQPCPNCPVCPKQQPCPNCPVCQTCPKQQPCPMCPSRSNVLPPGVLPKVGDSVLLRFGTSYITKGGILSESMNDAFVFTVVDDESAINSSVDSTLSGSSVALSTITVSGANYNIVLASNASNVIACVPNGNAFYPNSGIVTENNISSSGISCSLQDISNALVYDWYRITIEEV